MVEKKMSEIWQPIRDFVSLIEDETLSIEEREQRLLFYLDQIAALIHRSVPLGEWDGEEIPGPNYEDAREKVAAGFPNWGYYNCVRDKSINIGNTEMTMGDAVDDVTDIYCDLKAVLQCLDKRSENNALWQLQNSYKWHWKAHMLNLKLYVHCLEIEQS